MPHEYGMPVLLNACANQAVVFPARFNCDIVLLASWMFSERLYASREPTSMYRNIRISDMTATMLDKVECIHLIGFNSVRGRASRLLVWLLQVVIIVIRTSDMQHEPSFWGRYMRCTPGVLNWKIPLAVLFQDFCLRRIRNDGVATRQ